VGCTFGCLPGVLAVKSDQPFPSGNGSSGPGPWSGPPGPFFMPRRGSFLRGSYRSIPYITCPYVPSQEIKASYVSHGAVRPLLNKHADPLHLGMSTLLHDAFTTS